MLRLRDGQATLWEQMLPDQIQLMGPRAQGDRSPSGRFALPGPDRAREAPLSGIFRGK